MFTIERMDDESVRLKEIHRLQQVFLSKSISLFIQFVADKFEMFRARYSVRHPHSEELGQAIDLQLMNALLAINDPQANRAALRIADARLHDLPSSLCVMFCVNRCRPATSSSSEVKTDSDSISSEVKMGSGSVSSQVKTDLDLDLDSVSSPVPSPPIQPNGPLFERYYTYHNRRLLELEQLPPQMEPAIRFHRGWPVAAYARISDIVGPLVAALST